MSIIGSDPFALLAYQQGLPGAPLQADGAVGADNLDTKQRSITIGDVVPVVFCRRVGDIGGVLISPGATEARFENDASNNVTAYYELVMSEGHLPAVQVRDVFQRSCRVGTFVQTYNRRAGTWHPGNFIVEQPGFTKPECPYYCGLGGSYAGMTTGSFNVTTPDGSAAWDRQIHLFLRGGNQVTRLVDTSYGPTSNFVDVVQWMITSTSKIPAELIDTTALTSAALFTEAMGFAFDAELNESQNLEDFLAENAINFLLTKSKKGGKIGLRPVLPTASNLLSISAVTVSTLLDESRVILDSFDITWVPLADRKPFCALMLWRQQPENDIGLVRSTEVRYLGSAIDGPYEQHDLSKFCTSELHALRAGAFKLARRRYVTHTLRIKIRPGSYNSTLASGDLVQVKLKRTASSAVEGVHDYIYEVDRIRRARNGEVGLDLIHFPVDATGRSLVALDVMSAVAGGILLPTGRPVITCDVNSLTDTTPAADVGEQGPVWGDDVAGDSGTGDGSSGGIGGDGIGGIGGAGVGGGGGGGGGGYEAAYDPGISASIETLDEQEKNDANIPAGIGVGDSPPGTFLSDLNSQLDAVPPGEPFELRFSNYPISTWSISVTATNKPMTGTLTNIDNPGDSGGFTNSSSGGGTIAFTANTSSIVVLPAYVSYIQPSTGLEGVMKIGHGIFLGNKIDVALWQGGLAAKPPTPGGAFTGAESGGALGPNPPYAPTSSYSSGPPRITIDSITRTS